jgi:hypothetical protein
MSFKTDKLVSLMPDVYAARDKSSLVYKLLDTIGAEHMQADEKLKTLLKSHWVDYASGAALDGLGSTFGIERRNLRSGELESDAGFRLRLKSLVPQFTGGGTVAGVLGAVRSALGLPFHLEDLKIPDTYSELRTAIEELVQLREFSPEEHTINSVTPPVISGDDHELVLQLDVLTVQEVEPRINWQFTSGAGKIIQVERLDTASGFRSVDSFLAPSGSELVFSRGESGELIAALDNTDVSDQFTDLDGVSPAMMPMVPGFITEWRFRARGAMFDISSFDDGETLDPPDFTVSVTVTRLVPLTFDVFIPYFLQQAVEDLAVVHNYGGNILVFEGLPPESIQQIINQTKAAGVRGNVFFSLNFAEKHNQSEVFTGHAVHAIEEDMPTAEIFTIGGFETSSEDHDVAEGLIIGGVFDVSTFDSIHGFL